MAKIVQAVRVYGPKLERSTMVEIDELVDWMARHTGLNKSEVIGVLAELHDGLLFFNRTGRSVKLPDVGVFSPGMDRDGGLRIHFRPDPRLRRKFGDRNLYNGRIKNKVRIGWNNAEYKALWDSEHAGDVLEI